MLARSLADRKKWQQVVVTHGVCLEFIKKKNWISKNLYIIGPEVGLVFSLFSFFKKKKKSISALLAASSPLKLPLLSTVLIYLSYL